jgi:hypothetical protein
MGVRTPEQQRESSGRARVRGPSRSAATLLGCALFLALLSNGRAIDAGDTRPTERVAASLVQQRNFDLDEYPDVDFPFVRQANGHKLSIYPVLSAVMAAPVFALCRLFFALDDTGMALAGKLAASLFSALAAVFLFLAVGRRYPLADARLAALVFALGTTAWSTSQALWQHPAALLFLCATLLFMLKADEDERWAARAGLPLALMVAARHADLALAAVLVLGLALRWPRRIPSMLAWASPPVGFVLLYQWMNFGSPLKHGFSGSLGRFSEPWGVGQLGLLVSPAKGLLVFTPVLAVAAAGLVRAYWRGERWLAATLGGAALAHWLLMGRWSEWHGGESWGPRLMTDLLPLLLLFLPEGISLTGAVGATLAAVGIAVQALGAFAYDGRWERLYQREGAADHAELWDVARSPIVFHALRRVVVPALPGLRDGNVVSHEHPMVLLGAKGSRFAFTGGEDEVIVKGADATAGDVHLQRGARVDDAKLRLRGRWDALFLRVLPGARIRKLELRIAGHGKGTLYVGERGFWGPGPRFSEYAMDGSFRIRHPWDAVRSGGPDLLITTGRGGGVASIDWVALVAPGDPDNPLQLP